MNNLNNLTNNQQKQIRVAIAGREYVLASDEQEELVREAAVRVDKALHSSSLKEGPVAAILASLRLALDLLKAERAEKESQKKLEEIIGLL